MPKIQVFERLSYPLHNTTLTFTEKRLRERDNLFTERERKRESVSQSVSGSHRKKQKAGRQADRQQVVERIGGLSLVFASQVDLPPHQQ